MSDVSPVLISALTRRYTREQIETALDNALSDHLAGVTITSTSFGDGQASGQINGKPLEVIALCEAALQTLDGDRDTDAGLASKMKFGQRMIET